MRRAPPSAKLISPSSFVVPANTVAAGPGTSPSMRAARSRASRRSAPTRVIRAPPLASMFGPAAKSSLAFQASRVPVPSRSKAIGGVPGMSAAFESRPPAGSLSLAVSSNLSPFGT